MRYFANLILLLVVCPLWSQETLPLRITHYYSLTEAPLPATLLRYPADGTQAQITAILEAGDAKQNFTLIPANVASVVAARVGDQRYLLYSPNYLAKLPQQEVRDVVLALAAGYLVKNHQLAPRTAKAPYRGQAEVAARYAAESWQAGSFAGYVFYNSYGYGIGELDKIPLQWNLLPSIPSTEQSEALREGYTRAETILLMGPSAAYNDEGKGVNLPIRSFPFPPPRPSGQRNIGRYFSGLTQLGQIANQLEVGLDAKGYYERQYFYVHGGFALVTRIEQFTPDGTSLPPPERWAAEPYRAQDSWMDYLRELFTSTDGRHRVFVFIASNSPMQTDPNRQVDRSLVENWLSSGYGTLPEDISTKPFTPQTKVTALIYDFSTSDTDGGCELSVPSPLSSEVHLVKSGILAHIRP